MKHGFLLCAALACGLAAPAALRCESPPARELGITISADKTELGEGENLVVSVYANWPDAAPAAGVMLHGQINGKAWGADYPTLPTGVAHLVLPMPERGANTITVTDGKFVSNPLEIQVHPRHFDLVDDPEHQMVMEYESWFAPGYAEWGKEEATPLLGRYSSLDPRIVRQHALWFEEIGINAVELDWSNNLTTGFSGPLVKECEDSTELLFQVYASMPQHPKVLFLLGPEHNLWNSKADVFAGPWFHEEVEYLWRHYYSNPKYRDLCVTYEGKPLVLLYLNGPHTSEPPDIRDDRLTIRYVGAWQQSMHQDQYGVWSWYDQTATPVFHNGKCEAVTVVGGYPAAHLLRRLEVNWADPDAGGRNYGETFRTQWKVALKYRPRFVFINQWNEFEPPDEYNANLSNDLEPTLLTEKGDPRASGWGFEYFNLTRDEIAAFHQGGK